MPVSRPQSMILALHTWAGQPIGQAVQVGQADGVRSRLGCTQSSRLCQLHAPRPRDVLGWTPGPHLTLPELTELVAIESPVRATYHQTFDPSKCEACDHLALKTVSFRRTPGGGDDGGDSRPPAGGQA